MVPLGVPHISASGTLIKKPLGKSSNLAQLGLHAKFQPNWTIRLARARGVVRNLPYHFIIGGCLYVTSSVHRSDPRLCFRRFRAVFTSLPLPNRTRLMHYNLRY